MKVLVDTNIVLDVLLKQEPFCGDSLVILHLASGGKINGFFAAVSMTNIFYILRGRLKDSSKVYHYLNELNSLFTVAPITETTISHALSLRWKDFEDAVQYSAAKENGAELIITRNKDDFYSSDIPCMTPSEFIAYLKEKENE